MTFKALTKQDGRKIQRMETLRGKVRGGQRTRDRYAGRLQKQLLLTALVDSVVDRRIDEIVRAAEMKLSPGICFDAVFDYHRLMLSRHCRKVA